MKSATPHSYITVLVRSLNRDAFLLSFYVPAPHRDNILALYGLDAELVRVHGAVTEEVNGHIRYAWWQEALDGIQAGKKPHAHPVIEALAPLFRQGIFTHEMLSELVMHYRSTFPAMPEPSLADRMVSDYIERHCPEILPVWKRVHARIADHRQRYGKRRNAWLLLKLLWT